jgi:hypothetical protein
VNLREQALDVVIDRFGWLLTAVAVATATWLSVQAGSAHKGHRAHLEIAMVALLVGGAAVQGWRELRATKRQRELRAVAEEYRVRLGATLGNVIVSIAALIGQIHCAPAGQKRELQRGLVSKILASASSLCGGDGVRAVFYKQEGFQRESDLMFVDFYGRGDKPRDRFRRGESKQANRIFDLVDNASVDRCSDTMDKVDKDAYTGKKYRSWVTAAVSIRGAPRGFLSVDSAAVGAFDDSHEQILQALAELLGAGLAG